MSIFIERIGREGFKILFDGFNQGILCLGLLFPRMYADSTLVKANVSGQRLSPSEMTVEEFQKKTIHENSLFVVKETDDKEDATTKGQVKYLPHNIRRTPKADITTTSSRMVIVCPNMVMPITELPLSIPLRRAAEFPAKKICRIASTA